MNATVAMPQSSKKPQVQKEDAMWLQKEMINRNYHELATAHDAGRKVAATFVPGNLNELLMCFDFARSLPETNALQNGMRKKSGKFILDAERDGASEDVCNYVKADLGMMLGGDIGPTGEPLPKPDILLLSYTGCFTFMKWFELVRHKYGCESVMLHVPYQGEGKIAPNMREYVVKQLKETVIPALERVSGVKFDIDRLRQYMVESAKAEEDLVAVLQSAKHRPSPIDGYFGAVYYIGPIFTAFRGTPEATEFYRVLRQEIEQRVREGKGPITPDGEMTRGEIPPRGRGPAQLDELPRVLEDVLRRGRGGGDLDLREGRRRLRLRLPPRSAAPARIARRLLPGLLHQPQPALAHRHDLQVHRRVPGRRPADQLDQELQQLLGGTIADPARGGEAHRQAGGVHRDRPGRPALFLRGQRQEPAGELPADGQAEARRRGRCPLGGNPCAASSASTSGSTTTKAVVIDESQNVIGRGITNSRSNYDTAATIAKQEALLNGRFYLFRQALGDSGALNGALDAFLGQLERELPLRAVPGAARRPRGDLPAQRRHGQVRRLRRRA